MVSADGSKTFGAGDAPAGGATMSDADKAWLARQRRTYFHILRWGAVLFVIVQFAVAAGIGLPHTEEVRTLTSSLALLLGASGAVNGLAWCYIGAGQSKVSPLRTTWRMSPFDLPWSTKIPSSYFYLPIANAVSLTMVGVALGLALNIPGVAAWQGVLLVLPSMLWVGGSTTYGSIASLRLFHRRVVKAVEAEQLARESLVVAELTALRAQINPHFLFNALNTVADLIDADPPRAERTVERLASVFRHTLAHSPVPFTEVGEEVEFLKNYLGVEKERFEERLAIEWDVDAAGLFIPTMLLQPLVENALKHAIGRRAGGGTVRIAARREGQSLGVEVRDFGGPSPERSLDEMLGRGTGLSNVNDRLVRLFGERAGLRLEKPDGGGAAFRFTIPALRASDVGSIPCAP